jgi:hypothetical protein
MAPRTSKGKAVAKAPSPAAPAPTLSFDEVGDEFYEAYNDLLVIKRDLVATAPGGDRKRLIGELGEGLVSDGLRLLFNF